MRPDLTGRSPSLVRAGGIGTGSVSAETPALALFRNLGFAFEAESCDVPLTGPVEGAGGSDDDTGGGVRGGEGEGTGRLRFRLGEGCRLTRAHLIRCRSMESQVRGEIQPQGRMVIGDDGRQERSSRERVGGVG